jgi:hypothetical protein
VQRIIYKQLDHWQYHYLGIVLALLTDAKNNCKNRIGKQGNCYLSTIIQRQMLITCMFPENREEGG